MEDTKSSKQFHDDGKSHESLDDSTLCDCSETCSESVESNGDVSISANNPNPLLEDESPPTAGLRRRKSRSHYISSASDSTESSEISSSASVENNSRERNISLSRKTRDCENKSENSDSLEMKNSSEFPNSKLGGEKKEEHSTITDANVNAHDDLERDESSVRESNETNSSLADYMYEWLNEHRVIWKLGLKCGWGLLWSAYVCAVLVGLLVSAFVMGGILIRVVVKDPIRINRSLNFDYLEKSPVAFVPIATGKELYHNVYLVEKPEILKAGGSRVLPRNHRLKVTVSLTLPESEYNQNLGIFQVRVDFLDADGKILATLRRPSMLQYRSPPIRLLLTLLKAAPILTGYTSETQNLKVSFKDFTEGETPTASLRVVIEQRAEYSLGAGIPEIYTASLTLESELPLLKRMLWFWKKTLFVWVSMSIFTMELVFALLCCRPIVIPKIRLREATNWDASQSNRPGQR